MDRFHSGKREEARIPEGRPEFIRTETTVDEVRKLNICCSDLNHAL